MAPKRKSQQGGEGSKRKRTSPGTSGEAQLPSTAAPTRSSTAAAAASAAAAPADDPAQDHAPLRRSSRLRGPPPPPPAAVAAAAAADDDDETDWAKMTSKDAKNAILQMLCEHDMVHLYYLDCKQLTELAKMLVQHNNPHRKKDIQKLIDNHRQAYEQHEESSSSIPEEEEGSADSADGESSHRPLHELHDVELNELSCTLDYLFKIKAAIIQAETLLQEGKATAQTRKDDWMPVPIDGKKTSYSGFRTDIYVWAPETLKYEVCQGTFIKYFI